MKLQITGIHVEISEAFNTHVKEALQTLCEKNGVDPVDVSFQISKNSYQFRCDGSLHLGRNVIVRGHGVADEAYACVDSTMQHLTQRLRRHKERLVAHHKRRNSKEISQAMSQYVLTPEEVNGDAPAIIAELKSELPLLTVSEAVMRLDLSDETTMVFRNDAHGRVNVIYRRSDGNIGWVDPPKEEQA